MLSFVTKCSKGLLMCFPRPNFRLGRNHVKGTASLRMWLWNSLGQVQGTMGQVWMGGTWQMHGLRHSGRVPTAPLFSFCKYDPVNYKVAINLSMKNVSLSLRFMGRTWHGVFMYAGEQLWCFFVLSTRGHHAWRGSRGSVKLGDDLPWLMYSAFCIPMSMVSFPTSSAPSAYVFSKIT